MELMSLDDQLKYYVINNFQCILDILIKHEIITINKELKTPQSIDSFFYYDQLGSWKPSILVAKKLNTANDVIECVHCIDTIDVNVS